MRLHHCKLPALLALSGSLLCAPALAEDASCPQLAVPPLESNGGSPEVTLTADKASLLRSGLSEFEGSVVVTQGDKRLSAESLSYEEADERVRVDAESLFQSKEMVVRSRTADLYLGRETGVFMGTEFTLIDSAARGNAERLELLGETRARLDAVEYTTCAPGHEDWVLKASRVHLDREEGLGSARNARLHFAGVPILYLPYFQFPIDDRRRSGFLFPTLGESGKTGLDLRWPFYLNLAPNYDAQLIPRYMSKRGVQLGGEFRYLLPGDYGRGEVYGEHLPDDDVAQRDRSFLEYEHSGLLSDRLALEANYAEVSDLEYFEDLGGRINLSALTHLERHARLTYQAPAAYTVKMTVQDFQTLDPTVINTEQPYRRLPQITFDTLTQRRLWATRAGFSGEYVNFDGDDVVEGQRVALVPYLRTVVDKSAWYATGQLDLHHTEYKLSNTSGGTDNDLQRSLPVLSAESGLRFDRVTDSGMLQTLEPRAMYLYAPYREQDDFPVFDSGEPDFDIVQLFARNRFSGTDRISDANQITGAVTTRLLDPDSGLARISATFGQILRFDPSQVSLPDSEPPDEGATDVLAAAEVKYSKYLSTSATVQWSPSASEFNRFATGLKYRRDGRRFEFAYRYRRDILEQSDLLAAFPIGGRWDVIGRWRYSLTDNSTIESLAGFEYETCCWTARTTWRRYISSTRGDYDSGIYLQLELKGLGAIGSGFQDLLDSQNEYRE